MPAHSTLGLPALSPTMVQGNIARWNKKEGDEIQPGDIIAEIETDKATVDWEATEPGFLAKILLPGGSKDIPVGQVYLHKIAAGHAFPIPVTLIYFSES